MMARASGRIPRYTPSIYLPGSFGRYRQYPRGVRTSIPGAGVKAGRMVWGEQVLNLWGAPVARYTNDNVPLLGLGNMADVYNELVGPNWKIPLLWFLVGGLIVDRARQRWPHSNWPHLRRNRRRR